MNKNTKVGFIGCGNMATALISGISDKTIDKDHVFAYAPNSQKLQKNAEKYGFIPMSSAEEVCSCCEYIVMAVKPNIMEKAINQCADKLKGKAVISIAAGISTQMLKSMLPESATILRVMPNTPALVGDGATALCQDTTSFTSEQKEFATALFESVGSSIWIDERLIDAVIGVSGSGPAYVFMFIEALADGGVRAGLPRNVATELAIQTIIGSGRLAKETGMHPGALKDMVCSPGGTTIDAVASLEKNGFRGTVIEAVTACVNKSISIGKK